MVPSKTHLAYLSHIVGLPGLKDKVVRIELCRVLLLEAILSHLDLDQDVFSRNGNTVLILMMLR